MRPSKRLSLDGRQVVVLAAAMLCAILLLALAPRARGETSEHPNVDTDPTGAPYVAGELLVVYEPGTPETTERAVVRGSGGQSAEDLPGNVRLATFPGIKSEASEKTREQALQNRLGELQDNPRVEAADYNYIRRATFIPDDPRFKYFGQWGLKKTGFRNAWNDARGRSAKIAIVDSGIDQDHIDVGKILGQRDFVNGDPVAQDRFDHGTHVAGIAAALTNNGRGVAGGCPACRLLVAKVMDSTGSATDSDVIAGVKWSVKNEADIINLSFAGGGRSSALKETIDAARADGAVVVASAGNARTARQYPAAFPSVIAVSATNANDVITGFSSRGKWVDLAAPGTNVLSTGAGGGYYKETGTSQSAPFVSALAGLLVSEGLRTDRIRQRMQSTATDLGPNGDDRSYGHGRVNAARAVP